MLNVEFKAAKRLQSAHLIPLSRSDGVVELWSNGMKGKTEFSEDPISTPILQYSNTPFTNRPHSS
jgi:hypothetical protein